MLTFLVVGLGVGEYGGGGGRGFCERDRGGWVFE